MFYKEKGFYISLICGIVCLVAFGAICMNVFSDSGKDQGNIPVAQETPMPTAPAEAAVTQEPQTEEATTDHVKSEVKKKTPAPTPKAKTTMKKVKRDFCGQ